MFHCWQALSPAETSILDLNGVKLELPQGDNIRFMFRY